MHNLTVVCVNTRNYLGRGGEYVTKLYNMCQRHVPTHRFICLTDAMGFSHKDEYPPGVELLALPKHFNGWWAKLNLFKPGLLPPGRKLYLDLDVVVSDDITPMLSWLDEEHGFWALDDFRYPLSDTKVEHLTPEELRHLGGPGSCNSSVMMWEDDYASDVWTKFTPEAANGLHGDQNWITRVLGKRINIIPEGWACSFRFGMSTGPIMIFHGEIKNHQVGGPWMAKHWR